MPVPVISALGKLDQIKRIPGMMPVKKSGNRTTLMKITDSMTERSEKRETKKRQVLRAAHAKTVDSYTLVILHRRGTTLRPRNHGHLVAPLNQVSPDDLDKGPRSTSAGRARIALFYETKVHPVGSMVRSKKELSPSIVTRYSVSHQSRCIFEETDLQRSFPATYTVSTNRRSVRLKTAAPTMNRTIETTTEMT